MVVSSNVWTVRILHFMTIAQPTHHFQSRKERAEEPALFLGLARLGAHAQHAFGCEELHKLFEVNQAVPVTVDGSKGGGRRRAVASTKVVAHSRSRRLRQNRPSRPC